LRQANVPFFSISGLTREMFVALRKRVGSSNGQEKCSLLIFSTNMTLSDATAAAWRRTDEREQTQCVLVEMDGFESNEGVILIAATNRPMCWIRALRPGFDRRVVVPRPDIKGREEILRVHTRKVPLAERIFP